MALKNFIYYDTTNENIIFLNYKELKHRFCMETADYQNHERLFNTSIKKGFVVEVSYDRVAQKQVTKYYIKDTHELFKSNEPFVDRNVVKNIIIFLRKQKLDKIDKNGI